MEFQKFKPVLRKIIFVIVILLGIGYLGFYLGQKKEPSEIEEVERLATPSEVVQFDQELEFPIEEAPEEEASFKFILTEAKKVKLIKMQGNPIQSEPGQAFLILTLEIENQNPFPFEINNQNYLRLQGEEDKRLAPDFYNGPIEIPAVSTKKDELAFIVPEDQKQFKLLLGPVVEEEQEEIEINF